MLDGDSCYRALRARDPRFDGMFFVGVDTTGIYCRPVCSARTPGRTRVSFYRTAAEAESAGYRACLRCRPELAPGRAPVDAIPRLVGAAIRRIDAGYLDEHSLEELAALLGVSGRHLRRAVQDELGVSPVELWQSRRYATAKRLLTETTLPMTAVAHASGFRSLRRFNAAFVARHGGPPSALRRHRRSGRGEPLVLRLDYRPPLDWQALVAFSSARAVRGVEVVEGEVYRRAIRVGDHEGVVSVSQHPRRHALVATLSASLAPATAAIVGRLRAQFDLDAEPQAIADCLRADPRLRRSVARRPGLRVPGAFDPFEALSRAVLGQQVTVRGATTLAGRLAERLGRPLSEPRDGLVRTFPSADRVAEASVPTLAGLGMPKQRASALRAVASLVASGTLERGAAEGDVVARLREVPGIGPFTAEYAAMRAYGYPDAFVAGDLWVRRALGDSSESDARRRAEAWRPWRAYAVMHLWAELSEETQR